MHQPHQFVNDAGGHVRPLCLGVPDVPVGGLSSHLAAHLEAPLPFGRDRLAVPEGLQRFDADEVTSLRVALFGESGEDPRDQRVQPQWALAALLDHHGHVFLNKVPPPALQRVHRPRVAHPRARLYLLTTGASLWTAGVQRPALFALADVDVGRAQKITECADLTCQLSRLSRRRHGEVRSAYWRIIVGRMTVVNIICRSSMTWTVRSWSARGWCVALAFLAV